MIKKFLIAFLVVFIMSAQAYAANYFDIINQTLDTIERASRTLPQDTYTPPKQTNPYERPTNEPSMPQTPSIPQGRTYNQSYEYQGQAKTLGELPAGTLVLDPSSIWNFRGGDNNSGEIYLKHPIFWRKLEDNHYTNGATLLLSEFNVRYDWCHWEKGLRAWNESDVRRFLRTTFYNHLSTGFKNAIVNVNIPYADLAGKPATIVDNLFLLSIVEWGASDRANNGKVVKYDNLPSIYGASAIRYVESWGNYDIDNHYKSSLTRTINRPIAKSAGYSNDIFVINSDGTLSTHYIRYDEVRPAVNLKSTTKIKGPYKFNYYVSGNKYLIYYELDFSTSN